MLWHIAVTYLLNSPLPIFFFFIQYYFMRYRNVEKFMCKLLLDVLQKDTKFQRIELRLCIMNRATLLLSYCCHLTVARTHIDTKSPVYSVCLYTYPTFWSLFKTKNRNDKIKKKIGFENENIRTSVCGFIFQYLQINLRTR